MARYSSACTLYAYGVLLLPRTWVAQWWGIERGRAQRISGYAVESIRAVDILSASSPDAAAWWRENTPHLFAPDRYLVFHEGSKTAKSMTWVKITPWGNGGGNRLRAAAPRRARGTTQRLGHKSTEYPSSSPSLSDFNPKDAAAAARFAFRVVLVLHHHCGLLWV